MFSDWKDREEQGDEWAEEGSPAELSFGDPEGWRGENTAPGASDDEAWRGDIHLDAWPEWDAGPEYLMWKRRADGEA
jgi:hypothetical protein